MVRKIYLEVKKWFSQGNVLGITRISLTKRGIKIECILVFFWEIFLSSVSVLAKRKGRWWVCSLPTLSLWVALLHAQYVEKVLKVRLEIFQPKLWYPKFFGSGKFSSTNFEWVVRAWQFNNFHPVELNQAGFTT